MTTAFPSGVPDTPNDIAKATRLTILNECNDFNIVDLIINLDRVNSTPGSTLTLTLTPVVL